MVIEGIIRVSKDYRERRRWGSCKVIEVGEESGWVRIRVVREFEVGEWGNDGGGV